ncbi:MAG: 1-hydroxy-2-methyl-2-(E)-butenyl 4-diphosphate synthase, partial [Bacteroidetes bacterium]
NSINFISLNTSELTPEVLQKLASQKRCLVILHSNAANPAAHLRNAVFRLEEMKLNTPVMLQLRYAIANEEEFMLKASTDAGSLLIDGLVDGLLVHNTLSEKKRVNEITFGILQAARARVSKTEYISCPSCGRTLFDLQETTALIRKQTDHLKGVKIAIMGCIVNGPGEMADADYGYVGSGVGKITLYRGKEIVKKGIEKETAVDELIALIAQDGRWVVKEE